MELIHQNLTEEKILSMLKSGITTASLLKATGDKNCVRQAFELGAKVTGFKMHQGRYVGVLKIES